MNAYPVRTFRGRIIGVFTTEEKAIEAATEYCEKEWGQTPKVQKHDDGLIFFMVDAQHLCTEPIPMDKLFLDGLWKAV